MPTTSAEDRDRLPLYFLHVPRTGGTSLTAALEECVGADDIFPGAMLADLLAVPPAELRRYRLFRGHFGTVLPRLLDVPVRSFTVLRRPEDVVRSLLLFLRQTPRHPLHGRVTGPGYGMAEFLGDDGCRALTSNWQARWLAAEPPPDDWAWASWAEIDGAVPGEGRRSIPPLDLSEVELRERATATLDAMEVVGVTDRLQETLEALAHRLGWPRPEPIPRVNAGVDREAVGELDAGGRRLLAELNRVDEALYESARGRLDQAVGAMATASAPGAPSRPLLRGSYGYDCSMPLRGRGWHGRTSTPDLGWYRWSGPGQHSSLDLPVRVHGETRLRASIVGFLDPEVLASLRLVLAGVEVPVTLRADGAEFVVEGTVDHVEGPAVVDFHVSRTTPLPVEAGAGPRTGGQLVGIALRRLELVAPAN